MCAKKNKKGTKGAQGARYKRSRGAERPDKAKPQKRQENRKGSGAAASGRAYGRHTTERYAGKDIRDDRAQGAIRPKPSLPPCTADMPLPELLVPCGSEEALRAAVEGGADAVYLGGRMLNARMNAKNFDDAALRRAVEYCHSYGVKLYVTLNTLVYDRELEDAARYAEMLYRIGVDALIVADMGLCSLLREYLPQLELHASTQMAAHNLGAAKLLSAHGFTRMVLAREMSLYDVAELCKSTPIETEIFVHGALCVCRSGQCLFSSLVGGRSGNRGECAQPCRLPYNGGYPLSLRDLCLAEHITELIACGVSSLKIEGRMKSPSYIRGVARIYRRLLDERRNATPEEINELMRIFSRDGFTDGYFTDNIGRSMLGVRTERDKSASAESAASERDCRTLPARAVTERSDAADTDTAERTAAMPLEDTAAMARLEDRFPEQNKRNTARFLRAEQITRAAEEFFEIIALPLDEFIRARGRGANAVIMPAAVYDSENEAVLQLLRQAKALGAEHCYVGNFGHMSLARDAGLAIHGDFRLNITNSASPMFYEGTEEIEEFLLSPELILPQVRDIRAKKSLIVYGRVPLMSLERRTGERELKDRRGTVFPVRTDERIEGCRVRETVYNSAVIWMADKARELAAAGIKDKHFIFTVESSAECDGVIEAYKKGAPPVKGMAVRRIK